MIIYFDVDDVILNWHPDYAKKFNVPIPTRWDNSNEMKNRLNLLRKDKDFWLNLSLKHRPNFRPKGFVSARGIPKKWTVESLKKHNIPGRSNVYHVPWGQSKIELLKSLGCQLFIDDKPETYFECLKNGIPCLLMDAHHNQHIKCEHRIFDLKLENIMDKWQKFQ